MKISGLAIFAISMLLLIIGCNSQRSYRLCQGSTWGTTFHITYESDIQLDDSIISIMKMVDMSLSPFCDSSTVSLINSNQSVQTDSLFRQVFYTAQEISKKSEGAFDPTLSPIINMWGFGYRNTSLIPTKEMIDSALQFVGIDQCSISQNGHIIKKHTNTEFNFSAIAKGYGCDLIANMLKRNHCNNFLIEIGGEISVSGVNRQGKTWNIMIDAPVNNDSTVSHSNLAIIETSDCGIATSGNYRNFKHNGDSIIGHTIDRHSGIPSQTQTLSVTIISSSAMRADALATACMAMNPQEALHMIKQEPGTEALFVIADTTQSRHWGIITTQGFPSRL